MTYPTQIKVWSRIGHTPITGRSGAFCDKLAEMTINCSAPSEAREAAISAMKATQHGRSAHFAMPDYPNQNTNSGWIHT